MRISVPFFTQSDDSSCGPASIKMAAAFFGKNVPLEEIRFLTHTDAEGYTRNEDMIKAAEKLGFRAKALEGASVADIYKALSDGKIVIVNFIEPEGAVPVVDFIDPEDPITGHFAVVTGIDEHNIYLNDPLYGQNFTLTVSKFEALWRSSFEDSKRWLMTLSPKFSLNKYLNIFSRASSSVKQ